MLQTIFTVLLTFAFTGLIGNRLLHRWQQRNWENQQKFKGVEKDYLALKALFDEIVDLSGKRLFRMHRVVLLLRDGTDENLSERRRQYDAALVDWNEAFNSFLVRLTFLDSFHTAQELEDEVQTRFVKVGAKIEKLLKKRDAEAAITGAEITSLRQDLILIQGELLKFNRHLLSRIEIKRQEIYYGIPTPLTPDTLELFPTWNLIEALFKPRINPPSIIRSAADLERPLRSGPLWPGVDEQ